MDSSVPAAGPSFTLPVTFDVVPRPEQTGRLPNAGTLTMKDGRITVEGKSMTAAQTGAVAGGLVGALAGLAISAVSKKKSFTVDCTKGRAFADPRGAISLELPDGKWLAMLPSAKSQQNQKFLQALMAAYGERIKVARLGKMSPTQKKALIVVFVCLGLFLVVLAILAATQK
jgi:hypothetical protein